MIENKKSKTTLILKHFIKYLMNIFLIFFCITIISNIASANDYYVATWGSNANQGTLSDPWKNVTYAVNRVVAGDTIYLINGTWNNETEMIFTNSGNSTHPIILTAYNGTPILSGNRTGNTGFQMGAKRWIIIKNVTMKNYNYGVFASVSNNISIINVTIYNSTKDGITMWMNNNDILIDSVTIHDTLDHGIHIYNQQSPPTVTKNITIKNSTIYNAPHNLIDFATNITNSTIINNNLFFTDNYTGLRQVGIYLHNGGTDNILIQNNNLHDQTRPLEIINAENIRIINNTFTNIYGTSIKLLGVEGYDNKLGMYNSTFENNIINGSDIGIMFHAGVIPFGVFYSNLTFYNNTLKNITMQDYYIYYNVSFGYPVFIKNNIPTINRRNFKVLASPQNAIFYNYSSNMVMRSSNAGVETIYDKYYSSIKLSFIEDLFIQPYNMTARPTSDPATVTVNSFDTSLSAGKVLANFTANTTNGNTVAFTITTLTPGKRYLVNVGGRIVDIPIADTSGMIQFNYSTWPAGVFTVVEDASYALTPITPTESSSGGIATGKSLDVNQTPVSGATISMYTLENTFVGNELSESDGSFRFNNFSNGSYFVRVNLSPYGFNKSQEFKIIANSTTNIGNLTLIDLNMIQKNLNNTFSDYPRIYDTNHDGYVNVCDAVYLMQ